LPQAWQWLAGEDDFPLPADARRKLEKKMGND
jgi:hypothetical protein